MIPVPLWDIIRRPDKPRGGIGGVMSRMAVSHFSSPRDVLKSCEFGYPELRRPIYNHALLLLSNCLTEIV
jgi:hypothetical protein